MQLTIEIPEQDLLDFGRQTIQQELQASIKWLRLRNRLELIAQGLNEIYSEADHKAAVAQIRAEAWQEYKKDLKL